ncbi:MAG: ankyrin repeat domain-containing protein [Sutterellaceae bacterium]|nr:ankyrin repeat domain-containing protein [Sutterellaceae bacterium]MDY2869064.1 hypothetical protein [Mesosutterella sp.]
MTDEEGKGWGPLEKELCKALCEGPDFVRAEDLLRRGADPNRLDSDNGSILFYALQKAGTHADEIVRLLIRFGLDPRSHGGLVGSEALCAFRWKGNPSELQAVKLLLEAGADPNLGEDPRIPGDESCLQELCIAAWVDRWEDRRPEEAIPAQCLASCVQAFADGEPIDRFLGFEHAIGRKVHAIKLISLPGKGEEQVGPHELSDGNVSRARVFDGNVAVCCEGTALIITSDLVIYCNEAELEKKDAVVEDVSGLFPDCVGGIIEEIGCIQDSDVFPNSIVVCLDSSTIWASLHRAGSKRFGVRVPMQDIATILEKEALSEKKRRKIGLIPLATLDEGVGGNETPGE